MYVELQRANSVMIINRYFNIFVMTINMKTMHITKKGNSSPYLAEKHVIKYGIIKCGSTINFNRSDYRL